MIVKKLDEFFRGWFIGDFEPALLRTKYFEVGVLKHKAGEYWAKHYHALADEFNVLVEGKMEVNGQILYKGDVFLIEKGEVSEPKFLEDCTVVVVKVPSVIGDKYAV